MNLIVCLDENLGIGLDGNLLYNIPSDMEYFKRRTLGKTVIMGRKTYHSLRIKPLPNRNNVVLTNSKMDISGVKVCHSKEEVFSSIRKVSKEDVYVIGGSNVYRTFLDTISVAYVTKVYSISYADTFFPLDFENSSDWRLAERSQTYAYHGLKYSFNTYVRLS